MTITRDVLKAEIDNVQEEYFRALYKIIKVFESPSTAIPAGSDVDLTLTKQPLSHADWVTFIKKTYGCLADDPIDRGDQGTYEVREGLV